MSEALSSVDGLVTGPFSVVDRTVAVEEACHVVIFHNGAVWDVRSPGCSGGWMQPSGANRPLPATGQLVYLNFRTAPFVVTVIERDFRLPDGSRMDVEAKLQVDPVWRTDPSRLLDITSTYGPYHTDYISDVRRSLQVDFRSLLRVATGDLNRQYVQSVHDCRDVLRRDRGRVVVQITQVIDVDFSCDIDFEKIERLRRQLAVAATQSRHDIQLCNITSALELASVALSHSSAYSEILSGSDIGRLANELYDVPARAPTRPYESRADDARRDAVITLLLAEYARVIPFLAESLGGTPAEALRVVAGIEGATAAADSFSSTRRQGDDTVDSVPSAASEAPFGRSQQTRWALVPDICALIYPYLQQDVQIVGSALGIGAAESEQVAIIITGSSSNLDGVSRISRPTEDITVICVADSADKVDVTISILGNIGVATDHRFDVDIYANESTRIIVVTGVHSVGDANPDAARAIGAWLNTVTTLLDDTSPSVRIEV